MRFTCEKNMLVQGLNIAGRTVAQKSSLSVIEGILCRAGHGINLTGYNMETAITYDIPAEVADPGQCILPARGLDLELNDGLLTAEIVDEDGQSVQISVSLRSGQEVADEE